jgi:hypothetical protein
MRWLLLLPLFLLVGCSTRRAASASDETTKTEVPAETDVFEAFKKALREEYGTESDPFTLLDARVEGDSLLVRLQFGGGFREHRFGLFSVGPATKSLPRQQSLLMMHDSKGDMGRALITEDRAFDLKPYRDPLHHVVMIRLDGWPDGLDYTYSN